MSPHPRLPAAIDPLWRLPAAATSDLLTTLSAAEGRQRRRRPADAERYAVAVNCLAANLCALQLVVPGHALTVLTHPSASARSPVFGRGFNSALAAAERCGLLTRGRQGVFGTVTPMATLFQLLPPPSWAALSRVAPPAALLLRGAKDAHGRAPLLPFEYTPELLRMEQEVRELSAWLASLPVTKGGAEGWTKPT